MPRLMQFPVLLLAVLVALAVPLRPAAAFTAAEAKMPMTVTLVRGGAPGCGADCPEWLALTGVILPGTPALLGGVLWRLGSRHLPVLIDSPGGDVKAGMAMGRMIRARGLDVVVADTALTDCAAADAACRARLLAGERPGAVRGGLAACASACVLVLAGGVDRVVPARSLVGVHQMSQFTIALRAPGDAEVLRRLMDRLAAEASHKPTGLLATHGAPEALYTQVDRFLLGMGVGEAIMPLMRSTPPTRVHWMTAAELAGTRIALDRMEAGALVAHAVGAMAAPPVALRPATAAPVATRPAAVAAPAMPPRRAAVAALIVPPSPEAAQTTRDGTVVWQIDPPPATAPAGTPASLGAEIDIPGRRFKATLTLTPNVDPAVDAALILRLRFGTGGEAFNGQGAVGNPGFRVRKDGDDMTLAARITRVDNVTTLLVSRAGRDAFVAGFATHPWLAIPLMVQGRELNVLVLNLDGAGRTAIGVWLAREEPVPAAAQPEPFSAPATLEITERAAGTAQPYRAGTVAWFPLATPGTVGGPGTAAALAAVDIPDAGLHVSLTAGAAPDGEAGDLALDLHVIASPSAGFGPLASARAFPAWDADAHATLIDAGSRRLGPATYRVALALPAGGAVGPEMRLDLVDRVGRHVTLSFPLDGPVGAVLRAAAQRAHPGQG